MASLSSLDAKGVLAAAIYTVWMSFLLSFLGVYHTTRVHRTGQSAKRILAGNVIALATAASALFLFRLQDFSRGVLDVYFTAVWRSSPSVEFYVSCFAACAHGTITSSTCWLSAAESWRSATWTAWLLNHRWAPTWSSVWHLPTMARSAENHQVITNPF